MQKVIKNDVGTYFKKTRSQILTMSIVYWPYLEIKNVYFQQFLYCCTIALCTIYYSAIDKVLKMTNKCGDSDLNEQTFGQFAYSLNPEKNTFEHIQEKH